MSSLELFMPLVDVIANASLLSHFAIACSLIGIVLWLIFHRPVDVGYPYPLSDQEKTVLIEEWTPHPLVTEVPDTHLALRPRVVKGKASRFITVNGVRCLNMATHNFLNFIGDAMIERKAVSTLQKYGVGSCGPRGFYGTVEVHLELERRLAKFMEMEEAAVYSFNFSTIASAIPAYAKRGDVIFADENVNFAIQKGLDASRSKICYFKHNDMEYLEGLLIAQDLLLSLKSARAKAKVTRRFLVVEGIYINSGDLCPLPQLIELRKRFKLRLFIDESISFGTLGESGRGIIEHFKVPKEEVDLVVCSMEHAMATIGGFCVGSSFIVEHQRLSGLGYCFSASLPPLLTSAAIAALDLMEGDKRIFKTLESACLSVDLALRDLEGFVVQGDPISPIKHLCLKVPITTPQGSHAPENCVLQLIVDKCLQSKVALVVAEYLETENFKKRATIRITVNKDLTADEISCMTLVLGKACTYVLGLGN